MKPLDIGSVRDSIDKADARVLSTAIYREVGFFVIRGAIPMERILQWQHEWSRFYEDRLSKSRSVDPFNPVHVHEVLPAALAEIHQCPELLDIMQELYPDLALFMQRFVIKDRNSRTPVFVHNDFCYDYGWPEKTTVFIPLSVSNKENGGISFYPGTHHFGYLGDAGEVNTEIIGPEWPLVCPSLEPGDIALCHTCTWHCSPPHGGGPDRILVQATFQPASDPSSTALLRGEWRTRYHLSDLPRDKFFVRSRSTRLRELQAQVNQIEGHVCLDAATRA
ncbi:phytanoyl-CoA dioxygenase family protein [Billgrantia lactosivorans]|uniref:phytanoyl-CoA dioxygenase family protein n=1 Tax=Billgrantia lactosivorans TaxID=2185141 RepID=UPI000DADDF94|nr:phytanoyl-CoA dioxygenase family protein [Halomonas lactosivorans]